MRFGRALLLALLGAVLVSFASAQDSPQPGSLEADVRLPGAEARLGLGGGFWVGAWSELRLKAQSRGEYRARLEVREGTLRTGFVPMTVTVAVPDAAGVREARLKVPLFARRSVKLLLEGPDGQREVKLEPYPGTPAVVASDRVGAVPSWRNERTIEVYGPNLPADPALWLAGPDLVLGVRQLAPSTGTALAWLAAGGHVVSKEALPGLERLTSGKLGLGALEVNGETLEHGARGLFRRVVQGVPHRASVPDPTEPGFGWWSVGLFVCSLVAWSALRTHQTALIAVSVLTLVSAALGFWAWQPTHRVSESQTRLVIGAGGWGLETTIIERVQLHQGPVTLPPSVALLERVPVTYSQDATTLTAKAWSSVAYWTPPRATSVPLRVIEGRIENRSQIRLEEVFVVGSGVQEPLEQGSDKRIASNGAYPPGELDLLASALPTGAVIARARASKTLYIALPEDL